MWWLHQFFYFRLSILYFNLVILPVAHFLSRVTTPARLYLWRSRVVTLAENKEHLTSPYPHNRGERRSVVERDN